jgi:starch synthase
MAYFASGESWVYSHDEGIDVGRFLFFAAAGLRLAKLLVERENWRPNVIHVHDWHTGTVPYLLRHLYADDPALQNVAVLFSIHNMKYQGWGVNWHLEKAGIPPVDSPLLKAMGRADNCLAVGLQYSTMLSTVSPHYAEEIAAPDGGFGLDGLVHARMSRITGILNGIDVERWNPTTSTVIEAPFDSETLDRRAKNKLALQQGLGLPVRSDVPVLATVTRLVDQKGPDLLIPAMWHTLRDHDAQFVLLGSGESQYERQMREMQAHMPDKVAVQLAFNEPLAERISPDRTCFLVPSRFEPCGITQMIAMRYGSLPVVRKVGGLLDTVDETTGFLFGPADTWALVDVINRAIEVYRSQPDTWRAMQRRAMQHDFGWEKSARSYSDLYQQTVDVHQRYAQQSHH